MSWEMGQKLSCFKMNRQSCCRCKLWILLSWNNVQYVLKKEGESCFQAFIYYHDKFDKLKGCLLKMTWIDEKCLSAHKTSKDVKHNPVQLNSHGQ